MRKTILLVFFGVFFGINEDVNAANFFSFDQNGTLTEVSTRDGYGSARMGFQFGGQIGISHDCRSYDIPALPAEHRAELRNAAAAGVQATYALACTVHTPNAGRGIASRVRNEQGGPWMKVYTTHRPANVLILAAPQ